MELVVISPVLNNYRGSKAFFEVLSSRLPLLIKGEIAGTENTMQELSFTSATRCGIENVMKEGYGDIVAFFGHGANSGKKAMGQHLIPCLDACNIKQVAGLGLFLYCCYAARGLGQQAIEAGVEYCFCFKDKLYLSTEKWEWVMSNLMLYPLSTVLRGETPEEALDDTREMCVHYVELIRERFGGESDALLCAAAILYNMNSLVLLRRGDQVGGAVVSSCKFTPDEIQRAIEETEKRVKQLGPKANMGKQIPGTGGTMSISKLLEQMRERQKSGEWGKHDLCEIYMRMVLKEP